MKLEQLLQEMVDAKASDVFIIAGLPLAYEASGQQVRLDTPPFKPADTEAFVRAIYEVSGRNMDRFLDNGNHDEYGQGDPADPVYHHPEIHVPRISLVQRHKRVH